MASRKYSNTTWDVLGHLLKADAATRSAKEQEGGHVRFWHPVGGGNDVSAQPGEIAIGETVDDNFAFDAPWVDV